MKKYIISLSIIGFFLLGYLVVDSLLFNGIKAKVIHEEGFQGNYFAKENTKSKTSIILIGGGQWGDYWAQQFVNKGYVGFSLPYIGTEGLPKLPEEIDLEYFKKAINWLIKQPEVDPNKIIIMGASRNAELALVIASTFNELVSGAIAYAPSSVSWSNTVLPYNSDELKPSWQYKRVDIPYIPMDKISGNDSNKISFIDYWKSGLAKTDFTEKAAIQVENIHGPILLFSGNEDKVWPSSIMADMIEKRLKENKFAYAFHNIKYENAGHLISTNPEGNPDPRTGTMKIDGKDYIYEYGGTNEGDKKAKIDAKKRVLEFLEKI